MYERVLQYCCCEGGDCCEGGGSQSANSDQESRACSRRGGVLENQIAGATAARQTAVAIAIATRPFKFHEISVSNTSSLFVSSIHSFGLSQSFVSQYSDNCFSVRKLLEYRNFYGTSNQDTNLQNFNFMPVP